MKKLLYAMRHCETLFNAQHKSQGWCDSPITPRGIEQGTRAGEALAQRGGHIGYGVRYSEWNHGYGTQMLAMALEKAKEMRISPVLITCNDDNIASARVMEKNGFTLRDKITVSRDGKDLLTRQYWKTIL